jgi:hypothetical protein
MADEKLTRAAFAARHGKSKMAVSRWEKRGLLVIAGGKISVSESEDRMRGAGIETDALGETLPADPRELSAFLTDLAAGKFATQTDADRIKSNALAGLRVLEYRRKAGELIELDAATTAFFEAARATRDALMRWPGDVAPTIAMDLHIADVDAVARVLGEHVRKLLAGLAGPDPGSLRRNG